MSVNVTVGGVQHAIPELGDTGWGIATTNWIVAISAQAIQKNGGLQTLTAELDFGAIAGVASLYYKSRSTPLAAAGQVRLARTDAISWRNEANSADLPLGVNSSNQLTFNGVPVGSGGGGGDVPPVNPVMEVVTGAGIAVGATSSIDSASADGKQLARVEVWCSSDFKAELFKVENGVESAVQASGGGAGYDSWVFTAPHASYVKLGSSGGTDVFRVKVTNLGFAAADARVTFSREDAS